MKISEELRDIIYALVITLGLPLMILAGGAAYHIADSEIEYQIGTDRAEMDATDRLEAAEIARIEKIVWENEHL